MLSICLPVLISICKQDISKTDLWTLAKLIADDTVYVLSWRCLIFGADHAEDGRLSAVLVSVTLLAVSLTPSMPAVPNCCCSKGSISYWSNPLFLIFDIRALWRSILSAKVPECQKLKMLC